VAEVPSFIRLVNEVPGDELLVVGVSSEDPATLKAFTAAQGMNYPVGNPGELAPPFSDVTAIPTTFFIDRNGKIQKVFVGLHEFDELKRNATAADL
jgi:peroxiredoxin